MFLNVMGNFGNLDRLLGIRRIRGVGETAFNRKNIKYTANLLFNFRLTQTCPYDARLIEKNVKTKKSYFFHV